MSANTMTSSRSTPAWAWYLLIALAVGLGWLMQVQGQNFYLSMLSRMMIYGLAACSLNLILGYGGLVSFGHAAFVGIGAYTCLLYQSDAADQ